MRIAKAKELAAASLVILAAGCSTYDEAGYTGGPGYYGTSDVISSTSNPPDVPDSTLKAADEALAGRVRDSFKLEPTLAGAAQNVRVAAQNGTVTLNGAVATEAERQRLEAVARNMAGVLAVNNQLEVTYPPTGRPEVNRTPADLQTQLQAQRGLSGEVFNLQVTGLNETDRSLAQRILQGLQTDQALAALLPVVNIHVADGRVMLSGQVQNDVQRRTIESAVRQAAGANSVDSQIRLMETTNNAENF